MYNMLVTVKVSEVFVLENIHCEDCVVFLHAAQKDTSANGM